MEKNFDNAEPVADAVVTPENVRAASNAGSSGAGANKEEKDKKADSSSLPPSPQKHHKTMGQAWKDLTSSVTNLFSTARYHSVKATPGIILNNSSNLLGASHVLTEMMMLKASSAETASDGKRVSKAIVKDAKGPIDWTVKAFGKLFSQTLEGSKPQDGSFKEIIRDPKRLSHHLFDVNAATEREVLYQTEKAELGGKTLGRHEVRMGNSWQTRSTLSSLIVWSLSALIPDKKEDPKEVERMATLQQTNPLGYMGERLKQAVWFPDWGTHKRQMIGLGVMGSGVMSTLGAWRRREEFTLATGKMGLRYRFDRGYFITSAFTFLSSLPLLFASDDQKGFAGFGTLMLGRLIGLPSSVSGQFKKKEPGAIWYTGATASFQVENWAQGLIGGAEKNPDGSIIDHSEEIELGKKKGHELKHHRSVGPSTNGHDKPLSAPDNVVTKVEQREHAMPERKAEQKVDTAAPAMA